MSSNHDIAKQILIGIGGTIATFGLGHWESFAAIFAGFATGLYMTVKAIQALRKK